MLKLSSNGLIIRFQEMAVRYTDMKREEATKGLQFSDLDKLKQSFHRSYHPVRGSRWLGLMSKAISVSKIVITFALLHEMRFIFPSLRSLPSCVVHKTASRALIVHQCSSVFIMVSSSNRQLVPGAAMQLPISRRRQLHT